MANVMGMRNWADVFNGDNGIILPDTFTTDEFLKVFDKRMSKLYDGSRWDSGSYKDFTDKFVEHYKKFKIDHTSKQYVYSDGINSLQKCYDIVSYGNKVHDIPRSNLPLGIGTWFTNDFEGITPLNQVIKMWAAQPIEDGRWIDVCKISDSFGKVTGEKEEADLTMKVLGVNLEDLQKKSEEAEVSEV
jgi:nicotinate phosphoribosyltransferase